MSSHFGYQGLNFTACSMMDYTFSYAVSHKDYSLYKRTALSSPIANTLKNETLSKNDRHLDNLDYHIVLFFSYYISKEMLACISSEISRV